MSVKAGYSTAMLPVADIEKPIEFYELLGFEMVDTDRCKPIGWARLHCQGGAIMFLTAEEPGKIARGGMLVMYTPDLAVLREQLAAVGIKASAIRYPECMPSGEISLADPKGTVIVGAHWGKPEQEAWEKRIQFQGEWARAPLTASARSGGHAYRDGAGAPLNH